VYFALGYFKPAKLLRGAVFTNDLFAFRYFFQNTTVTNRWELHVVQHLIIG